MNRISVLTLLAIFACIDSYSQAVFSSKADGNWNSTASWNLVSGTSTSNYPVSGDSAVIQNGNTIQVSTNSQCLSLTIKGGSSLKSDVVTNTLTVSNNVLITDASSAVINLGVITITGNITMNLASNLTENGGVISVLGLIFVTSPLISAGSTILNIDNGVFTCVGGLTITATTIPAGRFAEIRIGSSSVNIAGALTTITANAKVNFTGGGTLTLAGIITVSNSSFIAGNGRVLYVGIPGTEQAIAALTYNKLAIAGIGTGLKTISGNVVVTDTLQLVIDDLQVNGSGSLTINNNAAIVRTAGKLISTPVFGGSVDVIYNNIQKDTTGFELPTATGTLRNLVIDNSAGVRLGKDITVNGKLTLQNGELSTGGFSLAISNSTGGAGVDPAVARTNGYVSGKINRTIGASTGTRIFPFGISSPQGYREFKLDYTTAPTTTGILSVQHFNSPAVSQSGFPLTDVAITLLTTTPYYWQADAIGGLAGGNYNLTLTAEGTTGVTNFNILRIIKRPSSGGSWLLNGTAGTNGGSNIAPVVIRNGMSNFSQFALGNSSDVLPLTLVSFRGVQSGGNASLSWGTINELNTAYFSVERSSDGISFVEISKIATKSTTSLSNYSYTDNHVVSNKNYYRLKIVDVSGNYSYTNIILLTSKDIINLSVSPTLVNSYINIISVKDKNIELYSNAGQLIKRLINGVNDISSLSAGVYFVRAGGEMVKIVKR